MRSKSKKFNQSILRAYDIRGIVGESLHYEDAYYIGRALATKIIRKTENKKPNIAVGRDGRISSPELHKNLVEGITDCGANVIDVEIGPSPMLYFSVHSLKLDGGVMITGSHNPSSHNGFKMMYSKAPIFGDEVLEMGAFSEDGDFENPDNNDFGNHEVIDVKETYVTTLLSGLEDSSSKKLSNMKIAWDPGNGAGGEITSMLVERLKEKNLGKHFLINEEIDGTFPAHHPDPSEEENLQQLIRVVRENNCDLGIAFDGDADRIGAVDSKGRVIWGDQLMTLFAEDVLKNNKGAEIIVDVKASETFFERVKKMGGKPTMWKTGHSFIKTKLAETNAPLAGEMSGHIFFNDRYYGFDDAIYSAVRLINFFAKKNKTTSEIMDEMPKLFSSSEYRVEVPEEDKFNIVEEIREKIKSQMQLEKISEIDGIRVKEENGWWLLRTSNTQAVITLRAEANTQENLDIIKNKIRSFLEPYGVAASII